MLVLGRAGARAPLVRTERAHEQEYSENDRKLNVGVIMANDAISGSAPVISVHGSQAPRQSIGGLAGGNSVPQGGKGPPPSQDAVIHKSDPQVLVDQLNKYLNDSGRPNEFRVDPASRGLTIQEINPATGEVIGQFSISQFPELARSLGVSGVLVDGHA